MEMPSDVECIATFVVIASALLADTVMIALVICSVSGYL